MRSAPQADHEFDITVSKMCDRGLYAPLSCQLLVCLNHPVAMAPRGHLPGAINVPLAEVGRRHVEPAARDCPVVIVCKTDRRSAKTAVELLASMMPACGVAAPMSGINTCCRWI